MTELPVRFRSSRIAIGWLVMMSSTLPLLALTTFHCDSSSASCRDKSVFTCEANQDCHINCIGDSSCKHKTFHCPSNADCVIRCGGTANDTDSCYQTLFTSKPDSQHMNITAVGTHSMAHSTVFCPASGECSISSLDGHFQLSHLNIYASDSYHTLHLYCQHNDCYAANENPTIFCSDFDDFCHLQLAGSSRHEWQCTAATAYSACNDNPFMWSTTKLFFHTTQTAVDDEIASDSSPRPPVLDSQRASSHHLQSYMQAIIIGCICAAAFCLVVLAICIILIYLNQTNSAALASIVDVDADADLVRVSTETADTGNHAVPSSRVFIYDASGKYINPNRRVSNLPKPKPRKKRKISHRRGKLSRQQLAKIAAKMGESEQSGQPAPHRERRARDHHRQHSSQTVETENIEISIVLPGGAPSLGNNLSNDTLDGYKQAAGNKRLSELQVLKEERDCAKCKPLKARLPSHFSNALHVQISDLAETEDASDSQDEGVPIERIPPCTQE